MKTEQEIIDALWRQAKKPSRNAATLTHNLGITFSFLETQWDDKARQIIGALVAVNASRMHTTIWAALFQQLRETDAPVVKVYILKQFANICWTVPRAQGVNAFRAFALEIRPLLSDVQIVTNNAFQKHFSTIIGFLRSSAEETSTLDLFNLLYANLVEWKRIDAVRAVSNVLAELVLHVPHCPTADQVLLRAKPQVDFSAYAILLETFVAATTSATRGESKDGHAFLCKEVDEALCNVLKNMAGNSKAIPSCVSSYRRLRVACDAWDSVHAAAFSEAVIAALEAESASKLLVCPFLQFLQVTSHNWWNANSAVRNLTESDDPFVRADAFLALGSKAYILDVSEKRIAIAELMEKLHQFITENCSYTIVAILRFLKPLMLSPEIPHPTQQLYLARLLHICCRYGKAFQDDTPAQLELLNVFDAAPALPDSAQNFTLQLFLASSDRVVAAKAFRTLLGISVRRLVDQGSPFSSSFSNFDDFFEGLCCTEQQEERAARSPLPFSACVRRFPTMAAIIHQRFLHLTPHCTSECLDYRVACDAIIHLCRVFGKQNGERPTIDGPILTILSHLVQSNEVASSDVYLSCVQAASACVGCVKSEPCTNVNLLLGLVQHSWSVLLNCAAALYPEFSPPSESLTLRFFRSDAVPYQLQELIAKLKDIALSNETALYSSAFFDVIESNIALLTNCIVALRSSPLFISETVGVLDSIFKCCDALFHCTPKHTFSFIATVFETLLYFHSAVEANARFEKQLAHHFSLYCSFYVSRAATLHFLSYWPNLCDFLLLFLQQDGGNAAGVFSELILNNWSTIAELSAFCEDDSLDFSSVQEGKTVFSILRLLRSLAWSRYSAQLSEAVPQQNFDRIAQSSQKWKWFPEKKDCLHFIHDLQAFYNKNRIENNALLLPQLLRLTDITHSFFGVFEGVVDFFNVSDEHGKEDLKKQLLHQGNGECLVSLAAIDNNYIPSAVEFVLVTPVFQTVLETLLLVISESEGANLKPLELFISDAVLFSSGDLIARLVASYRWGWVAGPNTAKMLSSRNWRERKPPLFPFLHKCVPFLTKVSVTPADASVFSISSGKKLSCAQQRLFPGISSVNLCLNNISGAFSSCCSAEEIILSNTVLVLPTLKRVFVQQDNFEDLSDPQVVFLFAKYIASAPTADLFSWELSEWVSLLRSWVAVTLTTQSESEQWGWLQLSCWTLFYRLYSHLFTMAKTGHPSYPKKNGAQFFEELRRAYLQLSNCFLCCNAGSVEEVAAFAARYALKNVFLFEANDVYNGCFWCIARTCVEALWLVLSREQWASLHDPEVLSFACRLHAKVGLPLHLQRRAHAGFSGLLLPNCGAESRDCDPDAQRHALWLISSFGARFYTLAAITDNASSSHVGISSNAGNNEVEDFAAFRSSILYDIFKAVRGPLHDPAHASPSSIFDALEALRDIARLTATSAASLVLAETSSETEQTYFAVKDFLDAIPPLSAEASLQPTAHCLLSLFELFPTSRPGSCFSDEYALSLVTTTLSGILASWLRRSATMPPPPAQVPCALALFLPYLVRLDLPLYLTALQCVETIAVYGARAEVEAVFKVVLSRFAEDLSDIRWSFLIGTGWYKSLAVFLGRLASHLHEGKQLFSRRLWEGMWRGADSSDGPSCEDLLEWIQRALRYLIHDLAPQSTQWELSRLVVLSSSTKRRPSDAEVAALQGASIDEAAVSVPLLLPPLLRIATDLERSRWRALLAETQAEFALCASETLDADSARSLLFEFEKALESLLDSGKGSVACADELRNGCLLRERVTVALLPSTEATLAALNHFSFTSLSGRRSVLGALRAMVVNESQPRPPLDMTLDSWVDIYFDTLFERATCPDEGLWVACAVAAVEVGGDRVEWVIPALQSLIAASSTRSKRAFLRRAGLLAKRHETQGRVRGFFAGASDRLAASREPLVVWKSELLVEVTFAFSA